MPSRDQLPPPPATPLRVLAGLLALFVLALACAVQSPAAHAWLHGGVPHDACNAHPSDTAPGASDDAGCPVTLFAQGLTLSLASPALVAPLIRIAPAHRPLPVARAISTPARLHPPAHAPPVPA